MGDRSSTPQIANSDRIRRAFCRIQEFSRGSSPGITANPGGCSSWCGLRSRAGPLNGWMLPPVRRIRNGLAGVQIRWPHQVAAPCYTGPGVSGAPSRRVLTWLVHAAVSISPQAGLYSCFYQFRLSDEAPDHEPQVHHMEFLQLSGRPPSESALRLPGVGIHGFALPSLPEPPRLPP